MHQASNRLIILIPRTENKPLFGSKLSAHLASFKVSVNFRLPNISSLDENGFLGGIPDFHLKKK